MLGCLQVNAVTHDHHMLASTVVTTVAVPLPA